MSGTCVMTVQSAHDAVSVAKLPAGVYLYRGIDANGNSLTCKFKK